MQCLILAGGLGTRMRPWTETMPKNLIPIHGRPFAFYQLELLKHAGIKEVVYSIGHQGDRIRSIIGTGAGFGLSVTYVDEGTELRGTGGAVRLAIDQGVMGETFFVLYGDSYLPTDYSAPWKAFEKRSEPALMTVFHNEGQFDKSNVSYEAGRVVLYDKKSVGVFDYIDYGLSILRRDKIHSYLPAVGKADLADVFNRLSLEGKLVGFEVRERFYEVGSPAGLEELGDLLPRRE